MNSGYYWTLFADSDGEWEVAEYVSEYDYWYRCGTDVSFGNADFLIANGPIEIGALLVR